MSALSYKLHFISSTSLNSKMCKCCVYDMAKAYLDYLIRAVDYPESSCAFVTSFL